MRDTTGGLRWHLRAYWQRKRWRVTTQLIAQWLDEQHPPQRELLLIGGSAGWMMSASWLQRFSRVVLVDIDPYAPRLFRFNHGRALRQSGTVLETLAIDAMQDLESLLGAYPKAAIFFDNVLGQHLYRVRELERAEQDLNRIALRLKGRDWGSVHDLFSGPVDEANRPARPMMFLDALNTEQGLQAEGLTGTPLHKRLLAQVGGKGEWMDHLSSGVFPAGSRTRLMAWPFLPHYAHWLQAGWVNAGVNADEGAR